MSRKKTKAFNYKSMIRSAARKIWMWSPMRKQAIINARIPGRRPYHVACATCGVTMQESIQPKLFEVDHIEPASEPSASIHDWNDFFRRLFVEAEEQQVLCHPCHAVKTAEENERRVSKRSKPRRK